MHHEEPQPILAFVLDRLPPAVRPWVDIGVLHAALAMVLLIVVARLATMRLQVRAEKASKLQMAMEWVYDLLTSFATRMIGPRGPEFVPLLGTFFLYIFTMNLMGLIPGLGSPTSRLGVTAALGVTAFLAVQYAGFRHRGWRYLMHFVGQPVWLAPLNIPVHIVGELARPLSLSVRLFGNIFGEDTMLLQFMMLGVAVTSAIYVPVPLQLPMAAFVIFGGFIQALVFTALTAAYIAGAIAEEH